MANLLVTFATVLSRYCAPPAVTRYIKRETTICVVDMGWFSTGLYVQAHASKTENIP